MAARGAPAAHRPPSPRQIEVRVLHGRGQIDACKRLNPFGPMNLGAGLPQTGPTQGPTCGARESSDDAGLTNPYINLCNIIFLMMRANYHWVVFDVPPSRHFFR